jgi:hypothetical protein
MRNQSPTNIGELPPHKPGVVITVPLGLLTDYLALHNLKPVSTRPDLILIVKKESNDDLQPTQHHLESAQDTR